MKISVVIPVYNFKGAEALTRRCIESVLKQKYPDEIEIVVSDNSDGELRELVSAYGVKYVVNMGMKNMPENTNNAINNATGDIIKILYQDDFLYKKNALSSIAKAFTPETNWVATGCIHTYDGKNLFNPHEPYYSFTDNTIGSPSVIAFRKDVTERFDSRFSWILDLDFYRRLLKNYGHPKILKVVCTVIGLHEQQMTHKLTESQKITELIMLDKKYQYEIK